MALEEYRKKRDFRRTPEPAGDQQADERGGFSFVIQKHAATRMHYDFRLELDGVLKSWAVPKGPSLDPNEKRLAVMVEDHPIEYGDFEGVIPKGEYGGGTVELWDRGFWVPEGDPHAGIRKGDLKFRLEGEKLGGSWVLVHIRSRDPNEKDNNWLLIKHKDDASRPLKEYDILEERPESVATGRTMEEIAASRDRVWSSKQKGGGPLASGIPDPAKLPGARKASLPATPKVELATLVDDAPNADDWLHEIKFDGYRILSRIQNGKARLLTRNAKDWTDRFAPVAAAVTSLPVKEAVFDGEVVVLLPNGTSSFQALQNALTPGRSADLTYFIFDLPYFNGYDLRSVPLEERKRVLRAIIGTRGGGSIRFSDHVVGNGVEFHEQACIVGVEGIISKRRDSLYVDGRTKDWLKVKCQNRQEFVIGGYTNPGGSRTGFGALHLGVYDGDDLMYVGKVGTGFDEKLLRELTKRLKSIEIDTPAFVNPPGGAEGKNSHWVKPQLVGEVRFTEWTDENLLRHPAFMGVREDRPARSVVRERKQHTPEETDVPAKKSSTKKSVSKKAAAKTSSKNTTAAKTSSATKEEAVTKTTKKSSATQRGASAKARSKGGSFEIAGITLSSPGKVYYPDADLTKKDVAEYYEFIWDYIAPYISGRPLTLVRCPEGYTGECFYQKHADQHMPLDLVHRVKIKETKEARDYLWVDSLQALLTLLQLGTMELHTWQSRVDKLEKPDRFILDLDPGDNVPWMRIAESSVLVKLQLDALGLESFVKTTGGKGLHVVVPLSRRNTWDEVVGFARAICAGMAKADPKRFTANVAKNQRTGRIYLDYLRNSRGATAVEAYSTRARPGGTVSAPIRWEELADGVKSDSFTIVNIHDRIDVLGGDDPWDGYDDVKQSITKEMLDRVM